MLRAINGTDVEQLTTRTAKLIPRPKKVKKVPGFATSYHFETDPHSEEERGNLYVVIEVLTAGNQAEAVADLVIEAAGEAYFNTGRNAEQDTLSRFEDAVKAVNQALADYTNKGNASWVGRLSAVIAVLCGEELHITQAGSAEAYLYRGTLSSHITADLQPKGVPKPVNTFSNIASGSVLPNDRLLLGTPALFHQVNKVDLKSLLTDSTANGAITKISERVGRDDDADRIAAIVIEITTPEMLALTTLPEEPEEIHLGKPDTALEVAKTMAAPAARSVASKGKAVGKKVLHTATTSLVPRSREVALGAAAWIRRSLSQRRNRQIVAAVLALVLALGVWNQNSAARTQAINSGVQQYIQSYQDYRLAVELGTSDKTAAKASLAAVSKDLAELSSHKQRKAIDAILAKRGREADDPSSISGLQELIAAEIDALDGIVSVSASVLTDLAGIDPKPTSLEVVGSTYVMTTPDGTVITYAADKPATIAVSKPEGFGNLIATTASSTGDGVYLLTNQPAVWFFNIADNTLTQQNAALDGWPNGKSIASYSGNLYILSDDSTQVWKHVKTTGGFGAKTAYFSSSTSIPSSHSLSVDGSIYLAGPSGIFRYTRGAQDQASADIPDALNEPAEIVVVGTTIITRDGKSNRIGVFSAPDNTINYSKQITLKGLNTLSSITSSDDGSTVFAIADGQLVSVALPE